MELRSYAAPTGKVALKGRSSMQCRPCVSNFRARRPQHGPMRVSTPEQETLLTRRSPEEQEQELHNQILPYTQLLAASQQKQQQQLEQQQQQQLMRGEEGEVGCIPAIFERLAQEHADAYALVDPHRNGGLKVTFGELWAQQLQLAAGLRALGLEQGETVSLFSENSSRWIIMDQAIMLNGCSDAVRGSTAPLDELQFIMSHADSRGLVVQDVETLRKMAPALLSKPWDSESGPSSSDAPASSSSQLSPAGSNLRFVVVLWATKQELQAEAASLGLPGSLPLYGYDEVAELGRQQVQQRGPFKPAKLSRSDLATLVFTSGTSGHPKAVMLSHGNLLYQVENLYFFMPVKAGQTALSLLPPWHIYERSIAYYILSRGAKVVYSNIRKFKDDLPLFRPDFFVCVPLVLDTLHAKVMHTFRTMTPARKAIVQGLLAASTMYVKACRIVAGEALQFARTPRTLLALVWAAVISTVMRPLHALACKLVYAKVRDAVGIQVAVVSGGGALAPHLDDFYECIGLQVLNGWGLSETSPVLACRRETSNVRGSIGLETPGTELRVVDPETLKDLPDGTPGLILARGPGVMQGYLKDDAATSKAFRAGEGWFDTGDLGWRAPAGVKDSRMAGNMVLTGRAKDTIVLSNGKKVEPEPIEGAITCSPLIKHAILLGQDKRELGALVFTDPETLPLFLAERAARKSPPAASPAQPSGPATPEAAAAPECGPHELEDLMLKEVNGLNSKRPDYHSYEHVAHVLVMPHPLSVEDGTLTRTMKPKRQEIYKKYQREVESLLKRLRG